ncbi:MAG: MBL fold metallo-hydrolase [Candidatus Rariloculaceae bacterium]
MAQGAQKAPLRFVNLSEVVYKYDYCATRGEKLMARTRKSPERDFNRREVLAMGAAGAGVGLASILGANAARAQRPDAFPPPRDPNFGDSPSWRTELKEIGRNCYTYVQGNGPPHHGGGISNAGFVVGDEGIFVFDTLNGPAPAAPFIERIREVSDKPFERIVYTHHHGDHTNGAQAFIGPGVEVVSSPYCRQRNLQMVASIAGGPADPAYGDISPTFDDGTPRRLVPATTVITGKTSYYYGGTVIELLPIEPAHTWGDVLVHLPEHKALWMGDNGFFHMAPYLHNGNPIGWMTLLETLLDIDLEIIVPGHGPAAGKAEVQEMLDYMTLVRDEARIRFDAGMSAGKAAAEIRMGRFDNWMGSERIILNLTRWYEVFDGTMEHFIDLVRLRETTAEYNTIVGGTPEAHRRLYRHDLHYS